MNIKEFLATYEEVLSFREISNRTGYTVDELRKIYDEMFDSGELFTIKEKVTGFMKQGGIVRINPDTFETKLYTSRADIVKDGFLAQNVVRACGLPETVSSGYLWRFKNDIDLDNVEQGIKKEIPNMYRPIIAESIRDRTKHRFDSIIAAGLVGYDITVIKQAIRDNSKYRNMYWRYE